MQSDSEEFEEDFSRGGATAQSLAGSKHRSLRLSLRRCAAA